MSSLHFTIPEFVTLDGHEAVIPITPERTNKIMKYHLLPMNEVRSELGEPIYVRSGYRPRWWERSKGRDPSDPSNNRESWSQHCYIGEGAGDYSIEQTSGQPHKPVNYWIEFFRLLKQTDFKRIAFYPGLRFFHCDYKGHERKYYNADWVEIGADDVGQLIRTNHNGN